MSEAGFLADTNVVLWALSNSDQLSSGHRAILTARVPIHVSAVSVFEIETKQSIGKLKAPDNLLEDLRGRRIVELQVKWDHAAEVGNLPLIHRDPFDRLLIAQARVEGLTLLTSDARIREYEVNVL